METNNNNHAQSSAEKGKSGDELIPRCQDGDKAAFNELVQRYQNKVFSYLRYALGDDTRAADATRRTFVEAYKNIQRAPGELSAKTWLLQLAEQELLRESGKQQGWLIKILSKFRRHSAQNSDMEAVDSDGTQDTACESIRALLSEYLDGELNELDGKRVEKHLRACSACFHEFDELQDTVMLLQSLGPKRAPIELRPQINAAIERLAPLSERMHFFQNVPLLQGVSATLMVVVLFGTAFLGREMQENQNLRRQVLENSTVRGSETTERPPTTPEPGIFVILTGSLLSEEGISELGAVLKTLNFDPQKHNEPRFIPGELETLLEAVRHEIDKMHGTVVKEVESLENGLKIKRLVVETPQDANQMFSLFLQQLRPETEQTEAETLSFEIYLVDKE